MTDIDTVGGATPTIVISPVRTREYLTAVEIDRLMTAARSSSRYGHRDATMILIGYRHGLRASELCDLQWHQVELNTGRLHVRRAKRGTSSVHPMQGDEIRALRRLQREQGLSAFVFMTERGGPMTPKAFHALFARIGERAEMPFPVHPHMLRHGVLRDLPVLRAHRVLRARKVLLALQLLPRTPFELYASTVRPQRAEGSATRTRYL
jgi:integrase